MHKYLLTVVARNEKNLNALKAEQKNKAFSYFGREEEMCFKEESLELYFLGLCWTKGKGKGKDKAGLCCCFKA